MTDEHQETAGIGRRSIPAPRPGTPRRGVCLSAYVLLGLSLGAAGVWAAEEIMPAVDLKAAALPAVSSTEYVSTLFVFMLATFVGLEVIRRVSRLLHTPLMSLTNAISAIAVVGSLLVAGRDHPPVINMLGLVAVMASVTNIVSGFLITDRMLKMFKKRGGGKHE